MKKSYDVVIIGGGIIGSSIAYFLASQPTFQGTVLVIEKDPTYSKCSTTLSVGGIRQQFSMPENIEISKFAIHFIKSVNQYLAVNDDSIDLSFLEAGYLFLATEAGKSILEKNYQLQKSHDVNVQKMSPNQLQSQFPWIRVSDLAGGCFGVSDEGWIDPYSLLSAFIKKAKYLGVTYLNDEVISTSHFRSKIKSVRLKQNEEISCGVVVNAAGIKASEIALMVGIDDFPVFPRKRFVYSFECKHLIPKCPLVIDPSGVYFRPEGYKFLCGVSPPEDQDPNQSDFKMDYQLYDEMVWPTLAHRVKCFESIKRSHSWVGHYAYNNIDQNAILGFHPEIQNFIFVNGFSGHGVQQAPAVGRAISELITFGYYQTLDLSNFSFDRFQSENYIKEMNVI